MSLSVQTAENREVYHWSSYKQLKNEKKEKIEEILGFAVCIADTHISLAHTVLSQASVHGRSQLKCQTLRVGGYTEKVLEWFN